MGDIFYNTDTEEVIDYYTLRSRYPAAGFPTDVYHPGVDARMTATVPPNAQIILDTYPDDIEYWERLYRDQHPTGLKLWEKAVLDAPVFNSGNDRWEQGYTVISKTEPEMIAVNQSVQARLEELRLQRAGAPVSANGLTGDATHDTQAALNRIINGILSDGGIEFINWEGLPDGDGLFQWADASLADLQSLSKECLVEEQKGYTTKRHVIEQQLETSYDFMGDVDDAFNDYYNNLEE